MTRAEQRQFQATVLEYKRVYRMMRTTHLLMQMGESRWWGTHSELNIRVSRLATNLSDGVVIAINESIDRAFGVGNV